MVVFYSDEKDTVAYFYSGCSDLDKSQNINFNKTKDFLKEYHNDGSLKEYIEKNHTKEIDDLLICISKLEHIKKPS